ncbi:acetyl-CoA carboxylase, biotin carboxyl carrier protein [Aphanothece hegewaldii CCALA 016]|uniref:Biotin carboxyl carrier protein of acetyl-CoA carboxylase n=1 Tax=Aphanothece hegewaldii CCALA 016 TaxID=2107694 RepID=A0A2T1LWS1_9CHRO|nr:acetyl-CoA carboxylase biotin carboxyl carrier protein [Aphanothece hegewaldii]PSF36606.1 acetyl-CoA carboxylase, biotin carboxyl carrier protein [Aphanothece hegewaldii CCALA 016]
MSINYNELRELLTAIARTDITELILKSDDFELTVRKGTTVLSPSVDLPIPVVPIQTTPVAPPPPPKIEPTPTEPTASQVDKKWVAITSPMVGTFYRASAPDEAPFVDTSDRIRNGQTVCIIEAMKLMNEIEAEVAGQIMEIVVDNGEPVEYGQTLMWVNPE